MRISINELGYQIKIHRDNLNLTQEKLVEKIGENKGINITVISNIENGKLPSDTNVLKKICETIKLPKPLWEHFLNEKSRERLEFENLLEELCGEELSTYGLDNTVISVIEEKIYHLFEGHLDLKQLFDSINSIIVYYSIIPLSYDFFQKFFRVDSFKNLDSFKNAISKVKIVAIRLFSSINEAYLTLNTTSNLEALLKPIEVRKIDEYEKRTEWNKIKPISDKDLPLLGYIAADKVKTGRRERERLEKLLLKMADEKANGSFDIGKYTQKRLNNFFRCYEKKFYLCRNKKQPSWEGNAKKRRR